MSKVNISLEDLLNVGAHFGHQTRRWDPKMEEYLYGEDAGVHIFDLTKTKAALEEALEFMQKVKKEGKKILFLGTKKQIKDKVKETAETLSMPFVTERWLGGTISNFPQIKLSLKKLSDLKKGREDGSFNKYTKKERLLIDREIARLTRFFGGLVSLEKAPEVLFIIDTKKEASAVREAKRKGVVVIGLVDSNADPTVVDYPIPMNDDAARAVSYVLDLIVEALK